MIKKVVPNVPPECRVIGWLYDSPDRTLLGEDMVEVILQNGVLVSAGWYPGGNTNGTYRIVASEGFDRLMSQETSDVLSAKVIIEDYVRMLHDGKILSYSDSTEQTFRLPVAY